LKKRETQIRNKGYQEMIYHQTESINKMTDIMESRQMENFKLKNIIELKILLGEFKNRFEQSEEWISMLEEDI
jgi:hypothetical protein